MKKISVITPVNLKVDCQNLFYALCACGNYRYVSFLDSSLVPDPYSKFSYIAWNPDFAAKSNGFKNEMINLQSGKSKTDELHPLVFLKRLFNSNINKDNEKLYDNGQ